MKSIKDNGTVSIIISSVPGSDGILGATRLISSSGLSAKLKLDHINPLTFVFFAKKKEKGEKREGGEEKLGGCREGGERGRRIWPE